jgi:hypothetical protein
MTSVLSSPDFLKWDTISDIDLDALIPKTQPRWPGHATRQLYIPTYLEIKRAISGVCPEGLGEDENMMQL